MENSSSDSDSEADYESLAGTSPHKDPGQLGSGQPTATVPKEGYLANQQNTGEVPTKIDQATQTSIRCFSPRLCLDLVGNLTEQQLKAEISRVYPRDYVGIRNTPRKQRFSLRQYYASVLMTDGETLTNQLDDLTAHFSRHVGDANTQLENLRRSIDSAQKMIDELQAPTVTLPDRAVDQTTPSPVTVPSSPTAGNYCVDKKPSAMNWINNRGYSVSCDVTLKSDVIKAVLKTSAGALAELNSSKNYVGSSLAGCIGGNNAHANNIVSGIFLATGQDIAQAGTSSMTLVTMECLEHGDLYVSVTMPCIEVGTVGGGTSLPAQNNNLKLLSNNPDLQINAALLAQVLCGAVLAGELSLLSALCSGDLVKSHMELNRAPG